MSVGKKADLARGRSICSQYTPTARLCVGLVAGLNKNKVENRKAQKPIIVSTPMRPDVMKRGQKISRYCRAFASGNNAT
jgi:hypothetical protein